MSAPRMLGTVLILTGVLFVAGITSCARGETVTHDTGGSVAARLDAMQHKRGVRIEGICYSACTMLLGLPDTCVTRSARLGFHGPSTRSGILLTRAEWDRVSSEMAAQYPPAVRLWFLESGRFLSAQHMRVFHGSELISMGVKECRG